MSTFVASPFLVESDTTVHVPDRDNAFFFVVWCFYWGECGRLHKLQTSKLEFVDF